MINVPIHYGSTEYRQKGKAGLSLCGQMIDERVIENPEESSFIGEILLQ